MLYLKNLLKDDPENEGLMIILAEQSLRSGNIDLSIELSNLLLKSEDKSRRHKATLLSYELRKERYYYLNKEIERVEAKKELRKLFLRIYYNKMYKLNEDNKKWYEEALFLSEDIPMYYFLKQQILVDYNNVELLENGYYLSVRLNKPEETKMFIKLLLKKDPSKHDKWILDQFHMLLAAKDYLGVEALLNEQMKTSKEWKKKSADYYLMRQSYLKATQAYIELMNNTKNYKEEREYFFKSVRTLQAGNYLKKATELAHKYEHYYINDVVVRKFLLRIYMATGNLNYASDLAKKILKKR